MAQLRTAIQSGDLVGIPSAQEGDWLVRESDLLRLPSIARETTKVRSTRGSSSSLCFPLLPLILLGIVIVCLAIALTSKQTDGCSKERATQAMLKTVSSQIEMFHLTHGRYPDWLEYLVTRPEDVATDQWPAGGYLTESPVDGWGREFVYRVPGSDGRDYDLVSLGRDIRDPGDDIRVP